MDTLFVEEYNEEIYQFWRTKTLARIKDKKNQELLAPEKKVHPFGTKRISLEVNYFECFNQDNVELISVREEGSNIAEFTEKGIITGDGKEREFDTIVFATGFDMHTGGLTQMERRSVYSTRDRSGWLPELFLLLWPSGADSFRNRAQPCRKSRWLHRRMSQIHAGEQVLYYRCNARGREGI